MKTILSRYALYTLYKFALTRLKKLEKIKSKYLKVICEEVNLIKKASYEEKNIEEIVKFIDGR